MRKILFFAASALLSITFAAAQTISIGKTYRLPEAKGFYPRLNSDGSMLAFSSSSYKGLEVYRFSDRSTVKVTNEEGAGLDPVFSNDSKKVFYKKISYDKKLRKEGVNSYSFVNKTEEQIIQPNRNIRQPQAFQDGFVVVADGKMIKSATSITDVPVNNYVWSDGSNLNIYRNGKTHVLNPVNGANGYVWASLSPDGTKILFTAAGQGTYACDLNGKIIANFGYLNAPEWYDNDFVVGMQDKDDGHVVTSSKILIKSLDGKAEKTLSVPEQIAMYPSAANGKVVYNTTEGDIYVIELKIKK